MATSKSKNSSIHVRVDSEIRQDAEAILNSMGITISQFINMALYQVHIKRRIPFEINAALENENVVSDKNESKQLFDNNYTDNSSKSALDIGNKSDNFEPQGKERNIWDLQIT